MILENRKILFLRKAKEKFGDRFDYSDFVYVDAKTHGIIKCSEHGPFTQCSDKHLSSVHGCPKCHWKNKFYPKHKKATPNTNEQFLEKARKKYDDKYQYDLTNYTGITGNEITIICPTHGIFQSLPRNHLAPNNKMGCPNCGEEKKNKSKTKSYDQLISDFIKEHGNKYVYPESNRLIYKNRRSIIDVECLKHGKFKKKAQKHLSGQGCEKCMYDRLKAENILVGGYCDELFTNRPELKNKKAILYYLKINDGQYYKIGITTVSVKNRIRSLFSKSNGIVNKIDIINTRHGKLYNIFGREQKILYENAFSRIYEPWCTELFCIDIGPNISQYFLSK